jgi:hypothetical protein
MDVFPVQKGYISETSCLEVGVDGLIFSYCGRIGEQASRGSDSHRKVQSMYVQRLTIPLVGLAAILAVCVAFPGVSWAGNGSLEQNPDQSVDEIPGQMVFLNDTHHAFRRLGSTGPCDVSFPGADRFVEVLNGGAYCDQKTGLVWERSPAGASFGWAKAVNHCATLQVAGWKGWSLPMREQLASLLDINSVLCLGGGLCLLDGHPFQNVQSGGYWSASTTAGFPTFAWMVNFSFGSALVMNLDANGLAWCVRDGQSSAGPDLAAIGVAQK